MARWPVCDFKNSEKMKTQVLLTVFVSAFILHHLSYVASAATTVDAVNNDAYGANLGWIDWHGDTANGAVVGLNVCCGNIYSANVGWINLGNGTPVNGLSYLNNSATDFGVNRDAQGNLRGYAYGANIGWVSFTTNGAPKMDLLTGNFSGYAYSANCGWISLSNASAYVQSTVFSGNAGSASSKMSGIAKPAVASSATITGLGGSSILYTVQANTNLATATWVNIGTAPAAAGGNLQFTDVNAPNFKQRFYRFAYP
jgi:hypothetical protein